MPRNGSGTYSLPAGNPVTTGTTISSTWANSTLTDIGTALTNSLSKDGQTTPTANIPMGTFKLTGLGSGSAATDSLNLGQAQNSAFIALSAVAGADTITATASPTLTAYATSQTFRFISAGANTGAVTLNIDSLGAKSITKLGTTALVAGDIPSGAVVEVYYDGTRFQLVNLASQSAATLASGATAVTQSPNDNSTKIATTAYSDNAARNTSSLPFGVGASVAASALTVTLDPCVIGFHSTTLTTGVPTYVNVSAQITMTVSSGSTLGSVNAIQSDIAILAINNAGTVELAVCNIAGGIDLSESGLISTTAEGGAGAADSASVIYSTTARTNVAYRVVGLVRSTQATAGTWATTPSLVQSYGGNFKVTPSSMVQLYQANGNGSTNTSVRRFSNVVVNQGTDITYADSATLGATFTINTSGTYAISYTDAFTAAGDLCIAINSTGADLTAFPVVLTNVLAEATTGAANQRACASATRYLVAGTIVRAQTVSTGSSSRQYFIISKCS